MRKNLGILLALLSVLATSGCSKQAKMARHLSRADGYYAAGDYDKAEIEYINALRVDPKSTDPRLARAYGRVGIMSLEDGRMARAYSGLGMAGKKDPMNLEYQTKLGMFFASAGKNKEARDQAILVLGRDPQNQDAPLLLADTSVTASEVEASRKYLQGLAIPAARRASVDVALGSLAMRQHDLKTALTFFERARAVDPKFSPLHSSMAIYYALQDDARHADEEFKAAVTNAPIRSPVRMRYVQFKVRTGDVAGAKAMLQETVQKAPDYLPGLLSIAEISIAERKYDEASECLGKLLSRDPDNFQGLLLSGSVAMSQTNAAKAVIEYDKLARAYPKSEIALYQLALAYNAANDPIKAIANLNQALALNPKFADASLALAQIKLARGDLSSAIVSLRQLTQQYPQLSNAHFLLAEALQKQGNVADAEQVYREFLAANPTNADGHFYLGNLLLQQRRPQARQEFNKAYELAPKSVVVLEGLTELDIQEHQYSAALERLQKITAETPNAREPALMVAKVWLAQGDLKKVAATLEKAIADHPDYIPAYLSLGNAYHDNKDNAHALEVVHRLLAKFPNQVGGEMLLALISDDSKDYKTARQAYEKVLEQNPQNTIALNNLAYLCSQHGDLDKAYELARKARELMPRDASMADTLGWICYQRGDYEQAAALLRESVEAMPRSAEVQLHFGLASYMTGDEDRARLSLQYAAQSKDTFASKELAARCLAILAIDPKAAGTDARATLEKAVADQPGDAAALSRLAAINLRDGNLDKAISNYEAILKKNPKNAKVMWELARIHAARPSERDMAYELAKSAYKIAPDNSDISRTVGQLAFQTGDYKFSYDVLKECARKSPADAELQFDLAQAGYSQGRVDEAQAEMRSALQMAGNFSRSTDAKRFLDIAPLAENPSAALTASAQIEQELKSDPEYVPALMASGIVQESKNDSGAAAQSYQKALGRYPDFMPAKRRIAILGAKQPGNDKQAYEYANQAREAYPNDTEVEEALGIIVYRQGDYTRSAKYLQECLTKKSGDPQLLYYLGMAEFKLHDRVGSKKNLLQAIDLKLPENLAGEARKALAQLN
jgi:tetratricopeptide (TPR) repeat protein